MKQLACRLLMLLAAALLLEACGGGGNGGGPTPVPQPPVLQSPQPPDYDVSGPWTGSVLAGGSIDLQLTQDGGVVLGNGGVTTEKRRTGFLAGRLSGSTLYFNFNYGSNCVRMVSGTALVGPSSMSGTVTGTSSCGDEIAGNVTLDSGRYDLAGTWTGTAPSVLGSGTWTWQLQQTSNRISGTASIQTNNLHETDMVQGVFYYPFAGPPPAFDMSLALSSSPCQGVSVALTPLRDTVPLTATQINGLATLSTACLGPGTFANFTLNKQ